MAKSNYNYDFWAKEYEYKEGGTRAEQDRQLKRSITNYNFGKAVSEDMDDLNVVAKSGAVGMDTIIQGASREIADAAGAVTQELQNTGDYNAYARNMSNLKSQVTEMKTLEADATAYMR